MNSVALFLLASMEAVDEAAKRYGANATDPKKVKLQVTKRPDKGLGKTQPEEYEVHDTHKLRQMLNKRASSSGASMDIIAQYFKEQ